MIKISVNASLTKDINEIKLSNEIMIYEDSKTVNVLTNLVNEFSTL